MEGVWVPISLPKFPNVIVKLLSEAEITQWLDNILCKMHTFIKADIY